jgi:hypothetical protein
MSRSFVVIQVIQLIQLTEVMPPFVSIAFAPRTDRTLGNLCLAFYPQAE